MASGERVLIAGAGLAGLALARGLHARGFAVHVIERHPRVEAHGAGILLTGNALRALDRLGVADAVLAQARRVERVRFTDERERELFAVDCAAQPGWPPFASIKREALLRVLLAAAAPVAPRFGVTIAALEQDGRAARVTLSDGAREGYALVVGADGVHSELRRLAFGGAPAEPIAGFHGWRFLAACPDGLAHPQYMLGAGRTLLLHPLPSGEVYCGAGPVSGPELPGEGDHARLLAAFADFGGAARAVLERVSERTQLIPTRYYQVEQRPWQLGRCVLIGDAAHACAPTLAQGGAMAFEDALVLCETLAEQARIQDALAAFEARRRPRVEYAQRESLARMQANAPLAPRARAVRNALLEKVGAAQLLGAWAPLMEGSP